MTIEYSVSDGVARVELARPEKRNALSLETTDELRDALLRGAEDARCVVLTGQGSAFCAGVDLEDSPIDPDMSVEELGERLSHFQGVVRAIRTLDVPVVSRVNGPAMGAGCDIALSADFRVAAHDAILCESFVNVGVVPGDGGAYLVPRLVGEARAKEMILLGKEVSGRKAEEMGLVNDAVPAGELDAAVEGYVERIVALPPTALRENKRLVNESFSQSLDEAHEAAVEGFHESLQSADFEEARRAFREGREPDFS